MASGTGRHGQRRSGLGTTQEAKTIGGLGELVPGVLQKAQDELHGVQALAKSVKLRVPGGKSSPHRRVLQRVRGRRRRRKWSGCRARSQGAAGRRGRAGSGAESDEPFRVEDGDVVGESGEAGCQGLVAQVALVSGGSEGAGLAKQQRQVLNEETAVLQRRGQRGAP